MMKPTIRLSLFVSFIVLSCALTLAEEKENSIRCRKSIKMLGPCMNDGPKLCEQYFTKTFGLQSKPMNCDCKTMIRNRLPNDPYSTLIVEYQKLCSCEVNCDKL
ncbi:hypothetical protein M5689_007988 [Euphorbia peplus]|nr:hypothetical protein M5689_007988 [Euphorbia peplus]